MRARRFIQAFGAILLLAIALPTDASAQAQYKVLYSFAGGSGLNPGSPNNLTFDSAGNLFGTVKFGGNATCTSGCGLIYELSPQPGGTWVPTVLYNFSGPDGAYPNSALVLGSDGSLYGTTMNGGDYLSCPNAGCGTIFHLTPNGDGSWGESVIYTFRGGTDGEAPNGVVMDAANNLYGSTNYGGAGTVFELSPNPDGSWAKNLLYSFTGGADGAYPWGKLTLAGGSLYGTTSSGGTMPCNNGLGCGTVFQLSPNADGTWSEVVLYAFLRGKDGGTPLAGVTVDAAGNLYGSASKGGKCTVSKGCGVVFELTPVSGGGWTEHVLHIFTGGKDGWYPGSTVILDGRGDVFGTTFMTGGVFKLQRNAGGSWRAYSIYSWPGNSSYAQGDLVMDKAGNLYGVAETYGGSGLEVYELTH